jgi:iron complex outermembrane receptor protein
VPQSGQQWGSDHSPEIDPLVASNIKVVKGAAALEYMGANLGSVIIVEPSKVASDPHLHGRMTYSYATNGRANGLNLQLEQGGEYSWKINGTLKKSGDKSSPNYFLRNTGSNEANLAFQIERKFNNKLFTDVYISTFNTTLGVLRGSHIGNLTDLTEALTRQVPFFTEDTYLSNIDAPKQRVNHHLAKFRAKYFRSKSDWFELTVAGQKNIRKEFDIRRGIRSEIPALSLHQYSLLGEVKYQIEFEPQLTFKTGIQTNFIDNTNDSETGILPLIPDYRSVELGQYAILNKKYKSQTWELGFRNSQFIQNVATITRTIPKRIEKFDNRFYNLNATAGWTYDYRNKFVTTLSTGFIKRNPAINELYSSGLHQGVSGIEEGKVDLKPEQSLKNTLTLKTVISKHINIEGFAYYQHIADYIYLAPQQELQLTIRGAFPLFKYDQTDARIFGLDAQANIDIEERINLKLAYSYLHGSDLSNDLPLIGMPSNNFTSNIDYLIKKDYKWMGLRFENFDTGINFRYVFRQSNLLPSQDFTPPPPSYQLTNVKASSDLTYKSQKIRLLVRIDNLFNVKYRDYLNRQRYFSDDLGRNIVVVFQTKF